MIGDAAEKVVEKNSSYYDQNCNQDNYKEIQGYNQHFHFNHLQHYSRRTADRQAGNSETE